MVDNTYNPVGPVNLMMNGPSADERVQRAKDEAWLTCTTLDDVVLAGRMHMEAGVPYSVARVYAFEPHANSLDEAAIRDYAYARYADLRNLRAAAGTANVLFQVNNEQGFREDDFRMYVHMIDAAMDDPDGPVGMCFWNGATGVVPNGFWWNPDDGHAYDAQFNGWTNWWALAFVHKMHEVRDVRLPSGVYAFVLGTHMYSMYYPMMAVNGGMHRKQMHDRWSADYASALDAHDAFRMVDWRRPQDHLGRDVQAIRMALGWRTTQLGLRMMPGAQTPVHDSAPVDCPPVIVTECGHDMLRDVAHVHMNEYVAGEGFTAQGARMHSSDYEYSYTYALSLGISAEAMLHPYVQSASDFLQGDSAPMDAQAAEPRGYRTMEKTWTQASWFPGMSVGEVLTEWLAWTWEIVLKPTGRVIGIQPFALGDTGGWAGFNVHGDEDYRQITGVWREVIPEHWLGENGEVPVYPYRAVVDLVNMGGDSTLRVRSQASTTSAVVDRIRVGDTIGYQLPIEGEDIGDGRGNLWLPVHVEQTNSEGFVHMHYVNLPDDQPEEPEPGEEPSADEIREEVKGVTIGYLEEVIERIKKL